MIIETDLDRTPAMFCLAPACQGYQAHRASPRVASNRACHVVARDLGHADVEKNGIGPLLLGDSNRGSSVIRGRDVMTRGPEQECETVGPVLAVVGDENLQ